MQSIDPCKKDIDDIHETLHTLVLWSHIIFLIGGIYAIYKNQYLIASVLLLETVISFIYHTNESSQFFATADYYTAMLTAIILLTTAFNKMKKSKSTQIKDSFYILIIIAAIAFAAYSLAEHTGPQKGAYDTEKGVNYDFSGVYQNNDPDVNIPVQKGKEEILYLVYHVIWHMVIGIVAIIIISL